MAYLMGSDNEGIVLDITQITDAPHLVSVKWRPAVIKSKKAYQECVEREEVKTFKYIYDAVERRTLREVHFHETREKPHEALKHTFADKQVRRKLEEIVRQLADEQAAIRVREAEALADRARAGRAERAKARAARDEDAIPLAGLAEPAMIPAGPHKVARVRAYPDDRAMRKAARARYGVNKAVRVLSDRHEDAWVRSCLTKEARARADPDDTAMARTSEIAKTKQTSALFKEEEKWAKHVEKFKSANSVNGPAIVLPEGLNAVPVAINEAWKEELPKVRNKKARLTSAASTSYVSTSSASTSSASTSAASKAGRRRTATSVEGSRDDPMDIQCLPFPHC